MLIIIKINKYCYDCSYIFKDNSALQKMEEDELDRMETDQKVGKREMEEFEEALLSEKEEDENEIELYDETDAEQYIDSPYPSDVEDFDDEDFVITDRLQDLSVHSSDESVVPVAELTKKLQNLRSTDSSPKSPMTSSSPLPPVHGASGQLLVAKECKGIGYLLQKY